MLIDDLYHHVRSLIYNKARHIKRGYDLSEVDPISNSCHLVEEAVELHSAILFNESEEKIKEEAADVLGCFIHAMILKGVTLEEISDITFKKLHRTFNNDLSKVLTNNPGFGREGRVE